jgi:organic radical activating enzyme
MISTDTIKDIYQTTYPVMESFYTLQGEGAHTGRAAYFIRLGGCDVGCVWCDVKDSWDADAHPKKTVKTLVEEASSFPGRMVVITGGEPAMHNLTDLTAALRIAGFSINIETSGAHALSGHIDWICFSPKKFKAPLPEVPPMAHELKVVIFNKSDFVWAESFASETGKDCRLYLQPEWEKSEQMTPLIIDYIHKHPKWSLSLQTHKYIGVP